MSSRMIAVICWLMMFTVPAAVMAVEIEPAMLSAQGTVLVNGKTVSLSTPVFPGDQIATGKDASATVITKGTTIVLPAESVILGDRNFGVLWVAFEAQQRGLGVVLRLTEARARKLFKGPISRTGEYPVVWQASRFDGGKHHRLPPQAAVAGRLIAARVGRGKTKQWLYLFTTRLEPAPEIVVMYGGRWHIETDLRSLKRTVRLHHMTVKSAAMLEKELLMAVCAYNLVRAVMCLAARQSRVDPRQLSFAQVLNVVDCAWPKLASASTPQQLQREMTGILKLAAQCTLPRRKQKRSYSRALWRRQPGFPYRHGGKTK